MKKNRALKVQFKSLESLKKELLALPKNHKKYIQPEDVIIFESLNGFRNFMTLQKIELLTVIASLNPKSVYELAKIVDRAIAAVQKDCNALESCGFIYYDQEKGGRKTITPKLKFNYDRIIVEMPEHPYELSFKSAA